MWKVVTSSNLNPLLKLFFYSPILTNNNLLLKIYCENIIVISQIGFFILYIISLFSLFISPICFCFFFLFFFLFLIFLFLLDSRTFSSVIRNREIKNKRLLAPLLIEGHKQALSLFCSGLLACSTVGQMAPMSFFILFLFD